MCELGSCHHLSRRSFIRSTGMAALGGMILGSGTGKAAEDMGEIKPCGPASMYKPTLWVAFVRRKEEYGMWWPGQIYDGKAALEKYTQQIRITAQKLGENKSLLSAGSCF